MIEPTICAISRIASAAPRESDWIASMRREISSVARDVCCASSFHLAGHDREAAARLARTCRLDGRVEREQVRLVGDRRDEPHHVADLLAGLGEAHDRGVGAARGVDRGRGDLRGLRRVARDLADRRLHLVRARRDREDVRRDAGGRGRDLAGLPRGTVRGRRDRGRHLRELLARARERGGRRGDVAHERGDPLGGLVEGARHLPGLVLRVRGHAHRQVALGEALQRAAHGVQAADDAARDEPGQRAARDERDERGRDRQPAAAGLGREDLRVEVVHLGLHGRAQVVERARDHEVRVPALALPGRVALVEAAVAPRREDLLVGVDVALPGRVDGGERVPAVVVERRGVEVDDVVAELGDALRVAGHGVAARRCGDVAAVDPGRPGHDREVVGGPEHAVPAGLDPRLHGDRVVRAVAQRRDAGGALQRRRRDDDEAQHEHGRDREDARAHAAVVEAETSRAGRAHGVPPGGVGREVRLTHRRRPRRLRDTDG
ncbi:hypothetical protein JO380_000540 [Cellulomonas iranensis]|uniref:Uncharacterized protein n=1 Tax=Cellulomonas iranensis TaxID=76862 RepID=A0ABU0GFM2_9CELL|nr:hypothetical protein [Cellulomonas iranensis]MDQ0424159.1 hypothetical protein [Cellulomonas iranensis]